MDEEHEERGINLWQEEEEEEHEEEKGLDLYAEKDVVVEDGPVTKRSKRNDEIPEIIRPGFQVTDNTSYYNLASLYVLLYAHVKEGVSIPALFSVSTKGFETNNVKFDF